MFVTARTLSWIVAAFSVALASTGCSKPDWDVLNESAKQAVVDQRPEDAERLFREAAAVAATFDEDDPRRTTSLNNLGRFLQDQGRLAEGVGHYREALDTMAARPEAAPLELARSMANLATHYQALDDLDEAERLLSRAIELRENELGAHDVRVGELLNSRGLVEFLRNEYDRSRDDLERALEIYRDAVPAKDPQLAMIRTNLAQAMTELGDHERSEAEFRGAVETLAFNGPSFLLATAEANHAGALARLERIDDAEAAYKRAIDVYGALSRPYDVALTVPLNNLGVLYRGQGRLDEAEGVYRRALEILEREVGTEHLDYAATMFNLGRIEADRGRREAAETLMRACLDIYRGQLGAEHPNVALVERALERLPQGG